MTEGKCDEKAKAINFTPDNSYKFLNHSNQRFRHSAVQTTSPAAHTSSNQPPVRIAPAVSQWTSDWFQRTSCWYARSSSGSGFDLEGCLPGIPGNPIE